MILIMTDDWWLIIHQSSIVKQSNSSELTDFTWISIVFFSTFRHDNVAGTSTLYRLTLWPSGAGAWNHKPQEYTLTPLRNPMTTDYSSDYSPSSMHLNPESILSKVRRDSCRDWLSDYTCHWIAKFFGRKCSSISFCQPLRFISIPVFFVFA